MCIYIYILNTCQETVKSLNEPWPNIGVFTHIIGPQSITLHRWLVQNATDDCVTGLPPYKNADGECLDCFMVVFSGAEFITLR